MAQSERTIRFWDDLYLADPTRHKEWILNPNSIIEKLAEVLALKAAPNHNNNLRILEIGCGTSTLSRDLWCYCHQEKNLHVSIYATDVSRVCIEQNQERDQEMIAMGRQDDFGTLEYGIFNITEPNISENHSGDYGELPNCKNTAQLEANSFDMILDKGCLDTFAFRSRQRGSQKDALVQKVLDNVFDLLKESTAESKSDDGGVYIIASPRSKFHAVRNYPGFAKMERTALEGEEIKAELVKSNASDIDTASSQSKSQKKSIKERGDMLYLYVCTKKDDFNPRQPTIHRAVTTQTRLPAKDTDTCPKCGISFLDFRKGEDLHGRGVRFWTRLFRGHEKHCKG